VRTLRLLSRTLLERIAYLGLSPGIALLVARGRLGIATDHTRVAARIGVFGLGVAARMPAALAGKEVVEETHDRFSI